ncbi:hypothetical protein [Variovorax jilinensis]|uniref:hypothetical protein n=1 Tax=Variovorax jilinensis TaxID=3053513 RepID=UPI002575FC13|nr:hypothetical protein [Variovorax sp. J22P168]
MRTSAAIGRVYELWPFLADSDPQAILELAVARTADQFRSALGPGFSAAAGPSPSSIATSLKDDNADAALRSVQEQIALLSQEMAAVRRELAQFSALRNNLITRLDDVVARAREAVAGNGATVAPSLDPLAEARRDRDMGVMKSTLSEILAALERIEGGRSVRA